MAVVTVRVVDSIVDHPRGAELTVEVTEKVRRRVRRGFYEVIDGSLDDPAPEPQRGDTKSTGGDDEASREEAPKVSRGKRADGEG